MAYTEFYITGTGSNLNAGSTTADAASLTYASGTWVQSTGVFTVASGDPVADGVIVGDWVSVYPTANTTTAFVGQVTARDTTTITVSTTTKIGSSPTDGTTTRTLKVGGAWGDFGVAASSSTVLGVAAQVAVATRVNIKAGTYAQTTNSRVFVASGTAAVPFWYRGYKTTPGDLDDLPTSTLVDGTDLPLCTSTTGTMSFAASTGYTQIWSNISFQRVGTANTTLCSTTANSQSLLFTRCRFDNQHAGAAAYAVSLSNNTGGSFAFIQCWFKATTTAARVVSADVTSNLAFHGCMFEGGIDQLWGLRAATDVSSCLFKSPAGDAISINNVGARLFANGNTFYGCGSDGIDFVTTPTSSHLHVITNNIFESCLYGVKNSTGTFSGVWLARNSYYNMTSGNTSGIGDAFNGWELNESASHFTNAGSGDFSLKSTSVAKGSALPQLFENNSNKSWGDVGSMQRQETAGGGSSTLLGSSLVQA